MKQKDLNRIADCIVRDYLVVSDSVIAREFDVNTRTVSELRRRLGLRKDVALSGRLRRNQDCRV